MVRMEGQKQAMAVHLSAFTASALLSLPHSPPRVPVVLLSGFCGLRYVGLCRAYNVTGVFIESAHGFCGRFMKGLRSFLEEFGFLKVSRGPVACGGCMKSLTESLLFVGFIDMALSSELLVETKLPQNV